MRQMVGIKGTPTYTSKQFFNDTYYTLPSIFYFLPSIQSILHYLPIIRSSVLPSFLPTYLAPQTNIAVLNTVLK